MVEKMIPASCIHWRYVSNWTAGPPNGRKWLWVSITLKKESLSGLRSQHILLSLWSRRNRSRVLRLNVNEDKRFPLSAVNVRNRMSDYLLIVKYNLTIFYSKCKYSVSFLLKLLALVVLVKAWAVFMVSYSIGIVLLNIECLLLPSDFSSSDEDEQQNTKLTPKRNIAQKWINSVICSTVVFVVFRK